MSKKHTIKTTLIGILTFTSLYAFGQSTKRETIDRHQQITSLSVDDIKSQQYAALAKELSIEDFMVYYIEYGKEKVSKKYGTEQIDSLYSDPEFTYYIHRTQSYPLDFIKIKTKDISNINISGIDGHLIRQKFIDEIIPEADKERVARKSKHCSMGTDHYDFTYTYDKHTRLLGMEHKWKITCDFSRVINKVYTSHYDIDHKLFKNWTAAN